MYFFFFLVKGIDQLCRLEKWDSIPDGFDNTWGIVKESGESSVFIPYYLVNFSYVSNFLPFCFSAQVRL